MSHYKELYMEDQELEDILQQDNDIEFQTIDKLADSSGLIDCFQIQIDESNVCKPVFLGAYPEVPLPVNKVIEYKKFVLHVVTYVLTKEEIDEGLYKIVGVNVFKKKEIESLCSLDLVMNKKTGRYQLLFNDHKKYTTDVVETLDKFPGVDKVLEYIIRKAFENPLKKILVN